MRPFSATETALLLSFNRFVSLAYFDVLACVLRISRRPTVFAILPRRRFPEEKRENFVGTAFFFAIFVEIFFAAEYTKETAVGRIERTREIFTIFNVGSDGRL